MSKWGIILLVVLFSISIRLWNLNLMGQTWDEGYHVIHGYKYLNLLSLGDFSTLFWYSNPDHPQLAKYFYGLAFLLDSQRNSVFTFFNTDFPYDWTYARFVSVLFSSLTIIFIMLLARKYVNSFVALVAGIIFATLPVFVGLSQIATIESFLMFFFTATVFFFMKYFESPTLTRASIAGFVFGCAMSVKFTNVLLVPLGFIMGFIFYTYARKKISVKHIVFFLIVCIATVFLLWPMPWFHLSDAFRYQYDKRFVATQFSIPEVFFGKLILVPKVYYVIYFLITTPLVVLALFLVGLLSMSQIMQKAVRSSSKQQNLKSFLKYFFLVEYIRTKQIRNKNQILFYLILMFWFAIPFLQSFYNLRQHGMRYIIEVYAPISIIAAIGFDRLLKHIKASKKIYAFATGGLVVYLLVLLIRITPYYLDFFNSLVGGTNVVYKKKLFQMGWWGQGLREAGLFVYYDAKVPVRVGLAVAPEASAPRNKKLRYETYDKEKKYDYVIVSYFHKVRHEFDDRDIKQQYQPVYSVKADQAELVIVYKSIQ